MNEACKQCFLEALYMYPIICEEFVLFFQKKKLLPLVIKILQMRLVLSMKNLSLFSCSIATNIARMFIVDYCISPDPITA